MRRLVGGYFGALTVLAIGIAGCGGGGSTIESGPTADAGRFRSCAEREIGTYPTVPGRPPNDVEVLTSFGLTGLELGEEGASVALLHDGPNAYVYEGAEGAEVGAATLRKGGLTPVVDENVVWDSRGALPANWEQLLHNCVGQSS